jgi:putative sigma-54 modulation protein
MNITITFRQMDPSNAVKRHAREKVAKLQKFLRQPMTAKVTLTVDRLRHTAETRITSGAARFEARESSQDMYASIDTMIDKLERQIRGTKGAAEAKARRGGATLRSGTNPTPMEPLPASEPAPAPKARAAGRTAAKAKPAAKAKGGAKASKKSR